jgi:hypothetical protein
VKRHELDPISLVFGVVFLAIPLGYLLAHTTSVHLHWVLVWPAALIVIGLAAFAIVIRRVQRGQAVPEPTVPPEPSEAADS